LLFPSRKLLCQVRRQIHRGEASLSSAQTANFDIVDSFRESHEESRGPLFSLLKASSYLLSYDEENNFGAEAFLKGVNGRKTKSVRISNA
jgi:hypothetical protein